MEISGGNYSFNMTYLSAHLRSYSVMLVDTLTIGETYNINVSAMNSVGKSTPFQLELSVTHLPCKFIVLSVSLVEHCSQLKINDSSLFYIYV